MDRGSGGHRCGCIWWSARSSGDPRAAISGANASDRQSGRRVPPSNSGCNSCRDRDCNGCCALNRDADRSARSDRSERTRIQRRRGFRRRRKRNANGQSRRAIEVVGERVSVAVDRAAGFRSEHVERDVLFRCRRQRWDRGKSRSGHADLIGGFGVGASTADGVARPRARSIAVESRRRSAPCARRLRRAFREGRPRSRSRGASHAGVVCEWRSRSGVCSRAPVSRCEPHELSCRHRAFVAPAKCIDVALSVFPCDAGAPCLSRSLHSPCCYPLAKRWSFSGAPMRMAASTPHRTRQHLATCRTTRRSTTPAQRTRRRSKSPTFERRMSRAQPTRHRTTPTQPTLDDGAARFRRSDQPSLCRTYSKSTGRPLMPMRGAAIHPAICFGS